jgi:hypothetical protein
MSDKVKCECCGDIVLMEDICHDEDTGDMLCTYCYYGDADHQLLDIEEL